MVAVDEGAEVDDDEIALDDAPVVRAVVRKGRVRAGGHDRLEAGPVGPAAAHGEVELGGEGALVDAVAQPVQHLGQGGVGDGGRLLDAGDLGVVLADAQPLDEPVRHDQLGMERAGETRVVGHGERGAFDGEAVHRRGQLGEVLALHGLRASDEDTGRRADRRDLLGRLVAVAPVGDEHRFVGQHEQATGRAR